MSKRTNTAQWEEKYQRWRIAVQKDGVRKQFYSSTPGRTGQREANAKADRWLDDGIGSRPAGGGSVSRVVCHSGKDHGHRQPAER